METNYMTQKKTKYKKKLFKKYRNCPQCNKEILYTTENGYNRANRKNRLCNGCSNMIKRGTWVDKTKPFIKQCVDCGIDILYKSKSSYLSKKERRCKECRDNHLSECRMGEIKKQYNEKEGGYVYICPKCFKKVIYKDIETYKKSLKCGTYCYDCRNQVFIDYRKKKKETEIEQRILKRKETGGLSEKQYEKHLGYLERTESFRTCILCKITVQLKERAKKKPNYKCASCRMIELWNDPIFHQKGVDCQLVPDVRFRKREKMILRILSLKKCVPGYNMKSCEMIDVINELYGWNLQHALNGKEVCLGGYFPDGHDKERSIIFEYDEEHHYYDNGELKGYDKKRQKNLFDYFKIRGIVPLFIRYDEKRDRLYIAENKEN